MKKAPTERAIGASFPVSMPKPLGAAIALEWRGDGHVPGKPTQSNHLARRSSIRQKLTVDNIVESQRNPRACQAISLVVEKSGRDRSSDGTVSCYGYSPTQRQKALRNAMTMKSPRRSPRRG
jgi:hypothetical protein